jgi:hypothetical protein
MRSNHNNYSRRNSDAKWGFFTIAIIVIGVISGIVLNTKDDTKNKDKIIESQNTYCTTEAVLAKSLLDTIAKLKAQPHIIDTVYIKPIIKKAKVIVSPDTTKIFLDTIKPLSKSLSDTISH